MVAPTTLRYALVLLLLAHGVGHTVGFWGETRTSWLSDTLGEGVAWALEVVWMLATAALFVGAALALLGVGVPQDLWRPLAVVGAALSIAGLFAFWGTWPGGTGFFALALDVALLVALLRFGWPSEAAVGW